MNRNPVISLKKASVILGVIFLICLLAFTCRDCAGKNKKLKPDGIVLHSYDCGASGDVKTPKEYGCALKNYHYLVTRDGRIIPGKPEEEILPHIGGKFVGRSLSVLVEGKFQPSPFIDFLKNSPSMTAPQEKALKKVLTGLMAKYKIPLSQVERHIEHDTGMDCPGPSFPYFELLYSMAVEMIKAKGNPLLEDICLKKGVALPIKNAKLKIDKSKYRMDLYAGKAHLKTYHIGLSRLPKGDKVKEGDLKTPQGKFYICEKYPMRAWMEISYPNLSHAKEGLKKKIIDREKFQEIKTNLKDGGIPPHNTGLGHDVGIHAGGFPYGEMPKACTAGCIALEDPEAFEVFNAVPLGTEVEITE